MLNNHLVSIEDINLDELEDFFKLVKTLKSSHQARNTSQMKRIEWHLEFGRSLEMFNLILFFYEASTRTRFSFDAAMQYLGGKVTSSENASEFTSFVKDETLEASIKAISSYADATVIRHPDLGSAEAAASVSNVPIINAGDGAGEHPTQALLDLFTIWEHLQRNDSHQQMVLTFVGDLRAGRTVHSLLRLVDRLMGTDLDMVSYIIAVSPPELALPVVISQEEIDIPIIVAKSLSKEIISESDVIYMTRTQKERGSVITNPTSYTLSPEYTNALKSSAIIMHPLPQNDELPEEVDKLTQARYYTDQVPNGLYVRMALLLKIFDCT